MRQLNLILIGLTLLITADTASALVNATLDRQRGDVGTPFLLTLEVTQPDRSTPDLAVLEQDFAILGSRKSALSSFQGGQAVVTQRWLITLSPRHPGTLRIPPISVGPEQSAPLSFTAVAESSPAGNGDISLESSLDLPLVYARSATTLRVRLFYRAALRHAEITEPLIEGVQIYPLGDQRYFKEQRQGQLFNVVEQRYTLLPERSAQFEIPPLEFTGEDADGAPLKARSSVLAFEAIPWPNSASDAQLAASELRLSADWDQPLDELRAGDTRTLTLTLEGHNIPAAWLPAIDLPQHAGVSSYPGGLQRDEEVVNGVLVSRLSHRYQLLFTQAGSFELPPITIPWWDYVREQRDLARLPLPRLSVTPFVPGEPATAAVAAPQEPTTAPPPSRSVPIDSSSWTGWLWALVALICAAGWSLARARIKRLEAELAQSRQQLEAQQTSAQAVDQQQDLESAAFSRLEHSCRYGDPERVQAALIDWARNFWPDERITELADIETIAAAPTLTYLLRNLEHRLQGHDDDDPWPGQLALDQISRLRRRRADRPPPQPTRITDHVEA